MVPLLLGAITLLVVEWRQERQLAQKQLSALAQTLVQAVDSELDFGRGQLEVIAASPLIDAQDWRELHRFAGEVASGRPGTVIALVGPDGEGLLNTAVPFSSDRPRPNLWKLGEEQRQARWEGTSLPLSSQTLTKQVFERGQPVYSDLYMGINTKRPTLALSVPVMRQGQVRYALNLAFPSSMLEKVIRSGVNAPGLRVAVVDRRGIVVATNAAAVSKVGGRALPIPIMLGSSAGHYEITAPDAMPLRGAYAVSANNGFQVRTSQERPFSSTSFASMGWVALIAAVLLSGALLASWVGRRMTQPLLELAQRTTSGQPPEGPPIGIAEIDALANALRVGAEAERQRLQEHVLRVTAQQEELLVKQSEIRLKRVLDQLFVFVGVLALDGRLLECNAAPLQRAGIGPDDVIGKPFWECHWWLHDAAAAQQVRRAIERAAQGEIVRFDTYNRIANGELLTVDLQVAPLRDDAGRIANLIASGVDVEARVKALHQLETSEARAVEAARRFDAEHRMLQATLDAAPVGIAVADPQCQLLQINQAGAELLGIDHAADRNLASRSLQGWRHTAGTDEAMPLEPDQWPLQRAVRQRRAVTSIIDIAPVDGSVRRRTVLMSAAPVLDAAGELIAAVVVQVDITKRVQAEAALRRADRQKDEFLATLAHELRNPLAPIRSAVELIRLREPADTAVQRARAIIERQALHLSRLVDDLLDVSRITLGTIQLRQQVVDLGSVALSAIESVRPTLEAAGLTLEQQIGPALVRGDAVRLAQCILNLLSNAVKFTSRGGRVGLRVTQEGPMAVVEVTDTGTGISPANLERIFELFMQEHPSGSGGNTGLGIGLALTRKLVELHGGTATAASAGPGHGSTFRIELPSVGAAEGRALPQPMAPGAESGSGTRVLVVDDNRDAAETLGEILAMSGFGTEVVYSGEAAVRAVERNAPDAVLLDIGLPDIDGYEVCARIRRSGVARQPVVIALTGWGQEKDRDRATAAGFNGHVTKPAEPDRIIALLNELVSRGSE